MAILQAKLDFPETVLTRRRFGALLGLCFVTAMVGVTWSGPAAISVVFLAFAVTIFLASLAIAAAEAFRNQRLARDIALMRGWMDADENPVVLSDLSGSVVAQNAAAEEDDRLEAADRVDRAFAAVLADAFDLLGRAITLNADRLRHDLNQSLGAVEISCVGKGLVAWRMLEHSEAQAPAALSQVPHLKFDAEGTPIEVSDNAQFLATAVQEGRLHADLVSGEGFECDGAQYLPFRIADREFLFFQDTGAQNLPNADLDRIPVAALTLAVDGTILTHNSMAQHMLGGASLKGRPIAAFMEGLGRPLAMWLSEAAEGHSVNRSEFLRLTRAQQETFVQVSLSRAIGTPSLVAVLTDATELKTLERQFVQSQKMQAIGQLAGGVAHDFNNLLTAISGHCDLLLLRHDQGDPDYADLIQINQNANRAAALVGQLLAFSRKQNMNPEHLDLRSTLSDLAHLLNRLVGEKITLTLQHDPSMPSIRADKRQLEQVMMNLVVNARDAMPEGGEIVVRSERESLTEPLSNGRVTVPPGEYARVSVTDEGVGIPPEMQQSIFEPFVTTKRTGEGTGLGLSTVYGIVKQSGGFIFVDSEVGKGSTFSLLFRLQEDRAQPSALPGPPEASTPAEMSGGVVLLVEDEAPVRAFASRALRLRGFTVIEADSGEAALEALEDDALDVDVVVTDVIMPGLDGPSWVRKALVDRPGMRVVFVSGYPEDVFERGDAEIPNSTFLPKPFSLKELTLTVAAKIAE